MASLSGGMLKLVVSSPEYLALKRAESWSGERVRLEQERRIADLLAWAQRVVPYYRSVLPSLDQIEQDPMGALSIAPLLTKAVIRRNGAELVANRWRLGIKRNTSGGSTGEPAVFYQDAAYRRWSRAGKLLFDRWTGVPLGHRKAVLWAAHRDVAGAMAWTGRLREWLWNRYTLDAYRMSEGNMRMYLDRLESDPPDQLQVYAESGYELARFALAEGRGIDGISSILSSAGTLYPDMRRVMGKAFCAPVFNRYGSREVSDIACECAAHQGLHVNPVTHYVEILREDDTPAGPGELGRVVVTSLTNFVQPLIRYEIGDQARWADGECACGCKWPLLAEVSGRVTDHLKSADGGILYGGVLRQLLYSVPCVQKYQWVQESLERVTLRVVFDAGAPPSEVEWQREVSWLEQQVQETLGNRVCLRVEIMDEIPPSASGKHLYVVSNV